MTKQSIEQLQQSIDALQKQLDELRTQQQPKKLEMWKPRHNQAYFYINDMDVEATDSCSGSGDGILYKTGNCFPTRELAEYYAKKRAARQRLEMLALVENGMVPYEYILGQKNYSISAQEFNRVDDEPVNLRVGYDDNINYGTQYFPTRAAAQHVLDAMTDEDCLLLWGTANRGGK